MASGPTLYATLYDARTSELRHKVEATLAQACTEITKLVAGQITRAIQDAYQRGVSDGFLQGVAAEAAATKGDE